MRSAVLFLVAAACFALVLAQETPCTPPDTRFEARIITIDREKGFEVLSRLAYDGEGRRIRSIEEVITEDSKSYYESIYLYNENSHYRIKWMDYKPVDCRKEDIRFPFRPYEPPRDAKYYGSAVIGSNSAPGEGVEVANYEGDVKMEDGSTGHYIGTWTTQSCLPVHDGFISQRTGFVNVDFYDVTLGIEDVNVFNPPDICFQ